MVRNWIKAALVAIACLGSTPAAAFVKQSTSGICHCPGGRYFDQTSAFNPFETLEACLAAGGRSPKAGQGQCPAPGATSVPIAAQPQASIGAGHKDYDRDAFGGWADIDGDCRNTRHELLAKQSTGPVTWSSSGCIVVHGRWYDPYTDQVYSKARDLDIDHLVPLAYAWSRGADRWSDEKRELFANDPANLFAVQASANRQKGAAGPLEWLPPSDRFKCQYLLRFVRIARSYDLQIPQGELQGIRALTQKDCAG